MRADIRHKREQCPFPQESVGGGRKKNVLVLAYTIYITIMVKPSAVGQPTRPTQPFIPTGLINE